MPEQSNGKRRPRSRSKDRRGQVPDLVSIHLRPPEIEGRLMPGHWEGALIMGANNRSAVGTLVERTTRLVLLAKLDSTTATAAATGFSDKLNEIPRSLRLSMTYDQGREMVKHTEKGIHGTNPIHGALLKLASSKVTTEKLGERLTLLAHIVNVALQWRLDMQAAQDQQSFTEQREKRLKPTTYLKNLEAACKVMTGSGASHQRVSICQSFIAAWHRLLNRLC